MKRGYAVGLAVAMAAVLALGQNTSQTPKIRVATRLVQVDVIVRDKNGPVENLTKDDFTVLDQGKPQEISLFSAISAETAKPGVASAPLPPNTFSNLPQYEAAAPRSITVVLLDNLNTLYGSTPESQYEATPYWMEDHALQNAKAHLIQFIEQLQPEDRVAIYGLRHSLHVVCDFTSDRAELLRILKNYDTRSITKRAIVEPGRKSAPLSAGPEAAIFENGAAVQLAGAANGDRGAETMAALQAIAGHVANIPGRKNLVWLTANLPFSGAEMARVLSPANIAVYPVDGRGLLDHTMASELIPGTADGDDVSGASGHLDHMPAQSSQPIGIATMEKVANETGGEAFTNTNDLTGAIRKAVEDSAVTYTLGFYISADSLDGKFHEIKVEVKQKGLTVRYPNGYFAAPETAPTTDENQRMLSVAVESPIESSEIPLEASLRRVNQPQPKSVSLECRIDIQNIQFAQSGNLRAGTIAVYVIWQDGAGKVLNQWDKAYNLQFTPEQYAALLKSGIRFHQYIQLRPDVTTLRVLVQDPSTSKFGSLIIPVEQVN
jgi:VWFA-related protein